MEFHCATIEMEPDSSSTKNNVMKQNGTAGHHGDSFVSAKDGAGMKQTSFMTQISRNRVWGKTVGLKVIVRETPTMCK